MPLHVFCTHVDEPSAGLVRDPATELQALVAQYRLGVETQIHFNQMILRTRVLGITGAVVVMGTAFLFRVQYPAAAELSIVGWLVPPAALMAVFGPVLLTLGYLMDRFYYLKLLGGASTYLYNLEDQLAERELAGVKRAFRQARDIQHRFGVRPGASTRYVDLAYGLVAAVEVFVIVLLATNK